MSLDSGVDVLVQPDGDEGSVLQVSEDEVDGLHHHLLNLLSAAVTHPHCFYLQITFLTEIYGLKAETTASRQIVSHMFGAMEPPRNIYSDIVFL